MKALQKWKVDRIEKLADEGFSQKRIAEITGISQAAVSKYDPRRPGQGRRGHVSHE